MIDSHEMMAELGRMSSQAIALHHHTHERPPTIQGPEDVRLFHDYVLIRELPLKETLGGIALPDGAERQLAAYVEKVGPGRLSEYGVRSEMSCKAGDVVYMAGQPLCPPIPLESDKRDATYYIIRDRELICAADGPALAAFNEALAARAAAEAKAVKDALDSPAE